MKKINIENKEITLLEGKQDGKIGVQFNSQEVDSDNFFYKNNGLTKETKVTKIILDLENNKILTEKKTYSITSTGDHVDTLKNPIFETPQEDVNLFMAQIEPLLVPAALNGIVRDMGLTRAIMYLDGSIIENQPIPIPENQPIDEEDTTST